MIQHQHYCRTCSLYQMDYTSQHFTTFYNLHNQWKEVQTMFQSSHMQSMNFNCNLLQSAFIYLPLKMRVFHNSFTAVIWSQECAKWKNSLEMVKFDLMQ